ncbi:PAS domain-containing protein [Flavobacterium sp. RHBU_24]|uniref:PAS domain-containing protein n=1 Tax=Flavobacterium sp. RHBU_24 TaxID=3391185 RepID=UPI0039854CCA
MLLTIILSYLRILSHQKAMINVEFGIALFATSFIITSLFIIWRATVYINRTESQKNAAEEYFQKAIEAAPSGFIITDKTRKITLMNSAAEEMFGYKRQEGLLFAFKTKPLTIEILNEVMQKLHEIK